ncbi:hypothetical protein PG990_009785 [Apiospora arundinis]
MAEATNQQGVYVIYPVTFEGDSHAISKVAGNVSSAFQSAVMKELRKGGSDPITLGHGSGSHACNCGELGTFKTLTWVFGLIAGLLVIALVVSMFRTQYNDFLAALRRPRRQTGQPAAGGIPLQETGPLPVPPQRAAGFGEHPYPIRGSGIQGAPGDYPRA